MIIGISGKIGSGKDTVAEMIQDLSTQDWEIKRFADKLKDIVCLIIGCTREELEDREFKEKVLGEEWMVWKTKFLLMPFMTKCEALDIAFDWDSDERDVYQEYLTPRKILQLLGTEGGREVIHPNIWVNALMTDYYDGETLARGSGFKLSTEASNWLVPDMRFPNELAAVKARGGITIRVVRPETDHLAGNHASETALDSATFDYTIVNSDGLYELEEKVDKILSRELII